MGLSMKLVQGQLGLPVPARHWGLCLAELPDHTVHHVEILLLLEALDCTHAADVVQTLLQLLHLILVVFNPTWNVHFMIWHIDDLELPSRSVSSSLVSLFSCPGRWSTCCSGWWRCAAWSLTLTWDCTKCNTSPAAGSQLFVPLSIPEKTNLCCHE